MQYSISLYVINSYYELLLSANSTRKQFLTYSECFELNFWAKCFEPLQKSRKLADSRPYAHMQPNSSDQIFFT